MFILLFLAWVLFNGQVTLEICCFGLIFATLVYLFCCKFLNMSFEKDILLCKKAGQILRYLVVLLVEIFKANIACLKVVISSKYECKPAIVHFKTDLKNEFSIIVLADSITLTPGTITVLQEGNELTVHCLDKSFAEGLDDSVFVKLLREFEK